MFRVGDRVVYKANSSFFKNTGIIIQTDGLLDFNVRVEWHIEFDGKEHRHYDCLEDVRGLVLVKESNDILKEIL